MPKKAIFGVFFRADRPNLVHKKFSEDFQCPIWIENMFRWIRSMNRTNSRPIWTRIFEDIAILEKYPRTLKKNPQVKSRKSFILLAINRGEK